MRRREFFKLAGCAALAPLADSKLRGSDAVEFDPYKLDARLGNAVPADERTLQCLRYEIDRVRAEGGDPYIRAGEKAIAWLTPHCEITFGSTGPIAVPAVDMQGKYIFIPLMLFHNALVCFDGGLVDGVFAVCDRSQISMIPGGYLWPSLYVGPGGGRNGT